MGWIPGVYEHRRLRERGLGWRVLPRAIEQLESRTLLADGILPMPGAPLMGRPGVPLTNVTVATFTITDPSGAPGTKWDAQIMWGDGQNSKLIPATPGPNGTFRFLGTHTYVAAGNFTITVMIAVPGSHLPNDNVVMTHAVIGAATGSVSGVVFNDPDDDGVQNKGERGLQGWTVNLLNGSTVVASAQSGSDGSYTISNIAPGNYTLAEVLKPGYTQSAPAPPGTYAVTITSGVNVTGKNFGDFVPVLQAVAVTPFNPTVPESFTQQFIATGTYSDHMQRDVTPFVTWASSQPTV